MQPQRSERHEPDETSRRSGPSGYAKRAFVVALALTGFGIAARLAGYQLGWWPPPPEPLFGNGALRVLNSPLSRLLPIPDAALGAAAYGLEAVLAAIGGRERYATTPLVVAVYGAVACTMGLTSAGLIVYQLAVVRAACTLCIVSALVSWVLVVPAVSEARAAWAARVGRRDATPRMAHGVSANVARGARSG